MSMLRRLRLATVMVLAAGFTGHASSLSPAQADEQLVYRPLVTDGTEYRRIPYPNEAGTLLVLAGTDVVVEAYRVPVAYWPITREYLADLSSASEPVEGTVEIVDGAGNVTAVEPVPYLTWHADGVGAGPVELIFGDETQTFYQDYLANARAAAEKAREYQRIVAERQAAVEAWLKIAAERPPTLPKPPPELTISEPEPYRAYASEPRVAAVTALPEGRYTVRLRGADGAIVPGSERDLVSFAPRAEAVGYVLRPEDRWTRPLVSFAPSETIYTTDKTDLYLQTVPVAEYEASRFTRLFRPQSVESTDPSLTAWVPRPQDKEQTAGAELALSADDASLGAVPPIAYRVSQLPGGARGYTIEEFEPVAGATLEPDFVAMRLGRDSAATELVLTADGATLPGSERQIRHVTLPSEAVLFLPSLLPLAVGVALRFRRRARR
jgi:hypothetical protein